MGSELRRMIRDGAPATWTAPMIHVAGEIADDARDPSQGVPGDGGWPWSKLPVEGHFDRHGKWRDGLTERCGMSARAISPGPDRAGAGGLRDAGADRHRPAWPPGVRREGPRDDVPGAAAAAAADPAKAAKYGVL